MSYLKYSFPLGNDPFRLRSLFCSSGLVLLRSCWAGQGSAWGGPAHPTSQQWGFGEEREAGRQLCVLAHPGSWAVPGAGCKLVHFRAAMRYIPSFARGHSVWSQIGGKQPKRRKTCHSLHPNKACWELHQHAQGFSTGNSDPDLPSQDKHNLSALFSDLMLGKPSAASVQGRGVLQHGCRLSPFLPLLARGSLWATGCCLLPGESCSPMALSFLLPCWEFSCGHTDCSTHPEPTVITQGDWFPQKTEAPRAYKGTTCESKGLHSLQFGSPMVHQEVPQETSVWW